jgi:cytochrome c peroxidase
MTRALSQFMLMMVNNNSKYDKVKRGEATFNLAEDLGYDIFKAKCAGCHTEPFFTDNSFRNTGMPLNPNIKDLGRMSITRNPADSLKFKVPSLRNVQWTAPYGHDGRFNNLDLVMEHYRGKVVDGPTTDPLVKNKIALSNFEIGQIKAFLYTLTDSTFMNDERFSAPQ